MGDFHPALQREIDAFDLEHPERDAQRNIAAGDRRILAIQGYGPTFPGIPDDSWLAVGGSENFRVIEGTSDIMCRGRQEQLTEIATRYAERYNRYLWASGTVSV